MADRLSIYKEALRLLGPSELASLTEDRPERHKLDDAWNDAVEYMLSKGLWNFAIRSVELGNDEDFVPLFGYDYSFTQPEDWVRTVNISEDPTFREGLRNYEDEQGHWFANIPTLYVRYVSNDADYGWNIARWRQPFAKALAAYLGFNCGLPISSDKGTRNDLYTLFKNLLKEAKTLDAVDERVQVKPAGRWTRARLRGGMRDRKEG